MAEDQNDQGLNKLTETMKENSKNSSMTASDMQKLVDSNEKLAVDSRNIRRHLLETKKLTTTLVDLQSRTAQGFEKFFETMESNRGQEQENKNEQQGIFEEIKNSLAGIQKNTSGGTAAKKEGGFFNKLAEGAGGILGTFVGTAGGIAALGLAIPAFLGGLQAGEYGLESLNVDFNFENIEKAAKGFGGVIKSIDNETLVVLGSLLAVSSFSGNPIKAAGGFALLGAAIPGFFGGLQVGEFGLSVLGSDFNFENIKKAAGGFAGVIKELDNVDKVILGGILGTALFISKTAGAKGALGIAGAMALLGASISGFFFGFALGDYALDKLDTNYESIPKAVQGFKDGIEPLDEKTAGVLAGLFATGGVIGVLGGFGTAAKVAAGMALIGAGIGGFFAGFEGMASIPASLGSDGSNMKNMLLNFSEGMKALDIDTLKVLGAFMLTGAALALFTGGAGALAAAAGIGAIGAGLGAFFAGFDGISKVASVLGVNGSATKELLTNLGAGLGEISTLDGAGLITASEGIALLGPALALFFAGKGAGGFIGSITDAGGAVKDFVGSIFGAETGKSIFDELAESLDPIVKLSENNALGEFNKFTDSMITITTTRGIDSASESWKNFGDSILHSAQGMQVAFEGGNITGTTFEYKGLKKSTDDVNELADAFERLSLNYGAALNTMSGQNSLLKLETGFAGSGSIIQTDQSQNVQRGGDNISVFQSNDRSRGSEVTEEIRR